MINEKPIGPYLVLYRNLDSYNSFFIESANTFDEAVQIALSKGEFVHDWHNDVFIAEYVPLRVLDGREVNETRFYRKVAEEYVKLYDDHVELSDEYAAFIARYEAETGNKWKWDEDA